VISSLANSVFLMLSSLPNVCREEVLKEYGITIVSEEWVKRAEALDRWRNKRVVEVLYQVLEILLVVVNRRVMNIQVNKAVSSQRKENFQSNIMLNKLSNLSAMTAICLVVCKI
jgi:hypothetical protein